MLGVWTRSAVDLRRGSVTARQIAGHVTCAETFCEPFSSCGADSSRVRRGFRGLDSDVVFLDRERRHCEEASGSISIG
jgi:hypothetical protein